MKSEDIRLIELSLGADLQPTISAQELLAQVREAVEVDEERQSLLVLDDLNTFQTIYGTGAVRLFQRLHGALGRYHVSRCTPKCLSIDSFLRTDIWTRSKRILLG